MGNRWVLLLQHPTASGSQNLLGLGSSGGRRTYLPGLRTTKCKRSLSCRHILLYQTAKMHLWLNIGPAKGRCQWLLSGFLLSAVGGKPPIPPSFFGPMVFLIGWGLGYPPMPLRKKVAKNSYFGQKGLPPSVQTVQKVKKTRFWVL